MYIYHNANPTKNQVGDCVIRAIATVTNSSWEDVYADIVAQGFEMYDMPSSKMYGVLF